MAKPETQLKLTELLKVRLLPLDRKNEIRIETKTDALSIIRSQWHADNYIEKHGDVTVQYCSEMNIWRVPEFAEAIQKYIAVSQKYFKKYGTACE